MATVISAADGTMAQFTRRFFGALVLDPVTFEDVEADRHASGQAAAVVLLACVAGGFAAVGSSSMTLPSFLIGMAATLGAWVVWAFLITTIGTQVIPEPTTSSRPGNCCAPWVSRRRLASSTPSAPCRLPRPSPS